MSELAGTGLCYYVERAGEEYRATLVFDRPKRGEFRAVFDGAEFEVLP
jgi:hypothetical protein